MIGGGLEPRYEPAAAPHRSVLQFRADYAASALHEAAHWCIAGVQRRGMRDFGYSYTPPPRSPDAQRQFFQAEARVQGLEAILCTAAKIRFLASVDDPGNDAQRALFERRVTSAQAAWRRDGLPPRAQRFAQALAQQAGTTLAASETAEAYRR